MQILTTRYDLEIRKLLSTALRGPNLQTILSSPQDIEFNPNFAKTCDICMVKNSVTRRVMPVLPIDTL